MRYNRLAMPAYPHIEHYYAEKERFIQFGGSDNELSIRRAFANCLDSYCRDHRNKLALVDELGSGKGNQPDGTVKDVLRMPTGIGRPRTCTTTWTRKSSASSTAATPVTTSFLRTRMTAVLFQNGGEAMRVDMTRPGELHRLIRRFLDFELPQIEDFRKAREQFRKDLPEVLKNLREAVEEAERANVYFQESAARFLHLCRQSIGPAVSQADVREMLLQHILTKDIFLRVFGEDQFHQGEQRRSGARRLGGHLLHRRSPPSGHRPYPHLLRRHRPRRRRDCRPRREAAVPQGPL